MASASGSISHNEMNYDGGFEEQKRSARNYQIQEDPRVKMPGYERPGTANFYEARSGETSLSNNYKRT